MREGTMEKRRIRVFDAAEVVIIWVTYAVLVLMIFSDRIF